MEHLDLTGRKGLIVGIANEHSLAWQAAQHFRDAGAELAVTYLNDKAKPFVEPLARELDAPLFLPCDVAAPGQIETVSARCRPAPRGIEHFKELIEEAAHKAPLHRTVDAGFHVEGMVFH